MSQPRCFTLPLSLATRVSSLAMLLFGLFGVSMRGLAIDSMVTREVWKMTYKVPDTLLNDPDWLAGDADNDGISNGAEIAAGTNPFSANSTVKIASVTVTEVDGVKYVSLAFPTVRYKQYYIQSTSTLEVPSSWVNVGSPVTGDATEGTVAAAKTVTVPLVTDPNTFYRVMVQDLDSDGDGVSDWAEAMIGYNPGFTDTAHKNNNTMADHDAIMAALAIENHVFVTATKATATQPASSATAGTDVGTITVTRTGTLLFSTLTVPLDIPQGAPGTAVYGALNQPGIDYLTPPTSVTFPPRVSTVNVSIVPKANLGADDLPGGTGANADLNTTRTATVNLVAGTGYTLDDKRSSASVVISPSGVPTGTGLTANYFVGASGTDTSPVNFGGNTVSYTYSKATVANGTATVTYVGTPGFSSSYPQNRVNLKFSTGALAGGAYDQIYSISSTTSSTSTTFTVPITGSAVLGTGAGTCVLNPPAITRLDPTVDFYWYYGTPNGYNTVNPDNFSATWDGYLSPALSGSYIFQLDADDKARVFLDSTGTDATPVQILENGWDSAATGGFKQSGAYNLTAGTRYHIHIDYVETTGAAKCKLQWKLNSGVFANISLTIGSPAVTQVFTTYTGSVAGATGTYYNNTNFTGPSVRSAAESLAFSNSGDWGVGAPDPSIYPDYFTARWTGQIQPQYSETYYFVFRVDDGAKLWVNGQLIASRWPGGGVTDITSTGINLQAGVLYDIKLEYYEATGSAEAHLSWYSTSQPKQIIPSTRLYPQITTTNVALAPNAAPPAVISSQSAIGFVGQPFSYAVIASNTATGAGTSYAVTGGTVPPGLNPINANTGVIAGTPTTAGDYQITVSATNPSGTGSSVVSIKIIDAGGTITREVFPNLPDGTLASLTRASGTPTIDTIPQISDVSDYPDNTGERLRGYFTAPTTGNYYFWIAANNAAELWIANDSEPVNKIRRAYVSGAPGTASMTWNALPTQQKSPWLALVAGQRYYFEVLHNTGSDHTYADNVAVGWLIGTDSTGTIANNTGLVPSYVFSPYDYPADIAASGTLYATNLQPQGSATTTAHGSANLRLSADNTQAILHFDYSGLGSPRTAYHIHTDAYDTGTSPVIHHPQGEIVFDIDDADKFHPDLMTADGGYIWNLASVGTQTVSDLLTAIQTGKAYLNIHTVGFPSGEIRGNFGLVVGSQSPPGPVPDPGYADDHASDAGAARFLHQAAYGAHPDDMAYVKQYGYEAWIDAQLSKPSSLLVPDVLANVGTDINQLYPSSLMQNAWWKRAVQAPDQLRQRMAFALSEIMVVSDVGPLNTNGRVLADHYDTLLDYAFADFRDLLKQVTLTSAMGIYLDMRGNQKEDLTIGRHPNENYGREVMQLFSIGLYRMWPDGTFVLNSKGALIPTYGQPEIEGVSRALTGWNYGQSLQANGRLPTSFSPTANYIDPMVLVPTQHELGTKRVLDNVILPAAVGYNYPAAATSQSEADPNNTTLPPNNPFDNYCLNDLEKALNSIVNNPNVGPYICRQLIQRLVTSAPSAGYLGRVVAKYNDDGNGASRSLKAVVKAILLDGEARSLTVQDTVNPNKSGKQREPIMRLAALGRTFPTAGTTGTYSQPASGTTQNQLLISAPNTLSGGSSVFLDFTGNLTQASPPLPAGNPTTTNYSVLSSPAPTPTSFAVNSTGIVSALYNQNANSNTITVSTAGPAVGAKVYLKFLTGGAPEGVYSVVTSPGSTFTVTTTEVPPPTSSRINQTVLIPKLGTSYSVKTVGVDPNRVTTITLNVQGNPNMVANDHLWFDATVSVGAVSDNEYAVTSVIDEDHLKIVIPVASGATAPTDQSQNSNTIWPLVSPPLGRTGSMRFEASTFNVGNTNADLTQTVLASPTVFNFFFPDYKYPGSLATNGVTSPEFQLTTDTNVVVLTNTLAQALLGTGGGNNTNSNGLVSYSNGTGKITLDLGSYQGPEWTSDANIPLLVDKMGDLLTGGTLKPETKARIVSYVTAQGTITSIATGSNCNVTAAAAHGWNASDYITISGVNGGAFTPTINGTYQVYSVGGTPATTLKVSGVTCNTAPLASALTNARYTMAPRDRVRAIIHLIVTSAEYAIQK